MTRSPTCSNCPTTLSRRPNAWRSWSGIELENRRLPHLGHALVNQVARQSDQTELGGTLAHALANRLRISRGEARPAHPRSRRPRSPSVDDRRTAAAAAGGDRRTAARRAARHRTRRGDSPLLHAVARFRRPRDASDRRSAAGPAGRGASSRRARQAGRQTPRLPQPRWRLLRRRPRPTARHHHRKTGRRRHESDQRLPDPGSPRHRRRRIRQTGRTGMCNPADATHAAAPVKMPSRATAAAPHNATTTRSLTAGRLLLASGKLGQHNGLPATIIVTTTLQELESGCGRGLTGGGTLLPMSDVIRLASHAHHYLAIFDNGRALALYHAKRLASPAQRIVLYAKDRGCTAPVATCPATHRSPPRRTVGEDPHH